MRRRLAALVVVVPMFAGASIAAAASPVDAATDALVACLDIAAADERLSCLEAAAGSIKALRAAPMAADAGEDAAADAGLRDDRARAAEAFAPAPYAQRAPEEKEERLDAGVTNIRIGALKNITITLDNGQVWRQLEGDRTQVAASKIGDARTVTLKKGPVGGYWMTLNEIDKRIRVKRIK